MITVAFIVGFVLGIFATLLMACFAVGKRADGEDTNHDN